MLDTLLIQACLPSPCSSSHSTNGPRKRCASVRPITPDLQIQTLNALALSILNGTNGFASRGTRVQTINERDVRNIISELRQVPSKDQYRSRGGVDRRAHRGSPGTSFTALVEEDYQGDLEGFAEFFPQYRQHLADHRQVDFDEQIYLCDRGACSAIPRCASRPSAAAEVLLVDEFQDLTPAHMLLLRLLAGPTLSIFAVGDDDQTIYGYSGATPEWLVEFDDHVPDAVHHALR